MRKALVLTAGLALALFAGRVFADDDMSHSAMHSDTQSDSSMSMGKSMKCEVVDVACYVKKGAHGPDHVSCAAKCISGGGELALLHKGKLYIPVDQDFHSARDQFVTKAGEMVDVTGQVMSKGGVNYLVLSPAADASAQPAAAQPAAAQPAAAQ